MSRTALSYSKKDYLISFKKKHPDIDITNEVFFNILNTGGTVAADRLLESGNIKMASRLGDLNIRKFKPHGKGASFGVPTDKKKSKEAGKAVYQFNDHTDSWMYRFFWVRSKCKGITDKNMWMFKPIRSLKRRLAQILKGKLTDYPILSKETN